MKTPEGLTQRQERFCQEFIVDFNATQAAIRAKYSKKTAQKIGYENLLKPLIQKRIKQIQAPIKQKAVEAAEVAHIDAAWVLNELKHDADLIKGDGDPKAVAARKGIMDSIAKNRLVDALASNRVKHEGLPELNIKDFLGES